MLQMVLALVHKMDENQLRSFASKSMPHICVARQISAAPERRIFESLGRSAQLFVPQKSVAREERVENRDAKMRRAAPMS